MKQSILEEVAVFLLKSGYTLKSLKSTCFDIIAKGNYILLIKILEDANSVSRQYAEEMLKISSLLNSSPLIIAEKAGSPLMDNIVYSRFGISCLNLQTFRSCISNNLPFIRRGHAGLVAAVEGSRLREEREKRGLSIGSLANKLGVSRKMVQKYESGISKITIGKALKMYDILGNNVFNKINIFNMSETLRAYTEEFSPQKARVSLSMLKDTSRPLGRGVFDIEKPLPKEPSSVFTKKFSELGFDSVEAKKAPFDILARQNKEIILAELGDNVKPEIQSLSKLIEADSLVIFKKKKPKNIPSMTKKEFLDYEKAAELIKFLKEFK